MGGSWEERKRIPRGSWEVFGKVLESPGRAMGREAPERPMDGPWGIPGRFMGGPRPWRVLGGTWGVSGKIWEVLGGASAH